MHLLAHEVAHTVQQGGGGGSGVQAKLAIGGASDAAEHEADHAADAMVHGAPAKVSSTTPGTVQRWGFIGVKPYNGNAEYPRIVRPHLRHALADTTLND